LIDAAQVRERWSEQTGAGIGFWKPQVIPFYPLGFYHGGHYRLNGRVTGCYEEFKISGRINGSRG